MTLEAGRKFGPYEIVEPIGKGGMGEVYRARDTKLDREVAIKVISEELLDDDERLARFEREAKLLASLNHRHIASIHGLEESSGAQLLVMELVPGETLAERLQRGPIDVDEALPLFQFIAEALAAAHAQGVVHRDLKPANIMITPDGEPKVLDFGLAKVVSEESAGGAQQGLSESPTAAHGGTQAGVILGTAPYMSPEQARGKVVDKRTDVWSFGCVLFEALSGRKPFAGETVGDTLASVLKSDPDFDALPKVTPWRVRDLLRRCLRKDPTRRLRAVSAAALDLEDAQTDEAPTSVAPPERRTSRNGYGLAAVLAIALAGVLVSRPEAPPSAADGVTRFRIGLPERAMPTRLAQLALSPDGRHLTFESDLEFGKLYIHSLDQLEPVQLLDMGQTLGRLSGPFFSPNGEWIGYIRGRELMKVNRTGGPPSRITQHDAGIGTAVWGSDGDVVFTSGSKLWKVPGAGGIPVEVPTRDPVGHFLTLGPRTDVIFSSDPGEARSWPISLTTGERGDVIEGFAPVYLDSGHIVLHQQTTGLLVAPFDPGTLSLTGPIVPLGETPRRAPNGLQSVAVSRNGTLAYRSGASGGNRLVWVNRDGDVEPLLEEEQGYHRPKLSPDGHRLVVSIFHNDRARDLWIYDLEQRALNRFTFDEAHDTVPVWSPDGRTIAFGTSRIDNMDVFVKAADGSGDSRGLTAGGSQISPISWTPDSASVLFHEFNDEGYDIGLTSVADGEKQLLLDTNSSEKQPQLSPNGRWLAYISNESGRYEVYVRSFPSLEGKWQVSTDGGREPVWSRSNDELFYRIDRSVVSVSVSEDGGFSTGRSRVLFEGDFNLDHANDAPNYDVSPDGQRFVMVEAREQSFEITVVLGLREELKRLAPPP